MTAVVIILILLGLLLLTPLGVKVKYTPDETRLAVYWGLIKINILPKKEKKKKEKPEKEKKEKKKKEPKKPAEDKKEDKKKKKRSLSFWLGLAKAGLSSAGIFLRGIAIDKLYAVITVAGSDPAKTAVNYGRACAAVGALGEYTRKMKRVKDCDVRVNADFFEDKMKFEIDAEASFLLYSVFGMGFYFVFEFIKMLIKEKRTEK